ncbi:MAG: hypothetical protein HS116_00885 [Planctomycetes bacterium]|nr:hypothetical protein [Planctomycetota bacterium]
MRSIHVLTGLCLLLCAAHLAAADGAASPYAKSKPGDWIEWKVSAQQGGNPVAYTHRETVVARGNDEVTVETSTEVAGQPVTRQNVYKLKEAAGAAKTSKAIRQEKIGEGAEDVTVDGKVYHCQWVQWKITVTVGENELVTTQKVWTSPDVPMGGKVKSEVEMPNGGTQTFVLSGFGSGK